MATEHINGYATESLEKRVLLMGHGLGGASAVFTAQKKPEKVRAVIALDPWLHILKDEIIKDGGESVESKE